MSSLELADRYDQMNKVAERYLKGDNPTVIARALNLKRTEVLEYINEFKEVAKNDADLHGKAREVLHQSDAAITLVVAEMWDVVTEINGQSQPDLKTKSTTLKSLADIEAKRVETWQKAGLLDDAALGNQLAEQEEKMEILAKILREVVADCEHCKYEVAKRLKKYSGQPEPIVVDQGGMPA